MRYAIVNNTIASLRKETSHTSELVDEVLYGMKVELLEEFQSGWVLIKTHYRYTGYIHSSDLLMGEEHIKAWEQASKKVVLQAYADVLSKPKVQGYNLISLTKGALVRFLEPEDANGWVTVGLWDGREGYMKAKFLGKYITDYKDKKEEELRRDIVDTALTYLGTQYRWGGKSPLGIDCSGLVSMAYLLNGSIIFRDARMEEGFPVHEIPYEQMKPGDLMYFPGHVAMYIGCNKYVHATAKNGSDGVVINSLNPKDSDYRDDLPRIMKAVGSIF